MGKTEFGLRLRYLRKQAGFSQRQIASQVGIDFTYLSKIENGVMPPPSEEVILKLSDVLNCDSDELLTLAGKIPSDIAHILKNKKILQSLRLSKNNKVLNTDEDFSQKLRELRENAGLSQSELAGKIGVSFTYLSKIENGVKPPPSEKVILKLAKALNYNKDELISLAGKLPSDIAQVLKDQNIRKSLRADSIKQIEEKSNKRKGANLMKYMMNGKRLARAALAVVLVCAVAASLWFAAPTPVKALTVSYPSLPATGNLGSIYTFQVKVNVETGDYLPVHSIDLELRNIASPGTYTATAATLPIPEVALTSTSKSYTSAQTGGGTITASASSAYGWTWATGTSRSGYGYRDPEGLGYHIVGGTTGGYGYGYSSNRGDTSITYTIVWTPPTNWPAGNYNIRTFVYADAAKTKKWAGTSSSFTLSAAPDDDDDDDVTGPGAPTTPPEPIVIGPGDVDVSKVVDDDGEFTQDVTVDSPDGNLTVEIGKGNVGTSADDEPVTRITITEDKEAPPPPADATVIGITYDINAWDENNKEVTFDNPVPITLTYDPDNIPAGVNEEDLKLAWYDEDAGKWVELTSIVDPEANTITAEIIHFSKYAIIAPKVEEEPTAPPTPPTVEPTEPVEPPTPPTVEPTEPVEPTTPPTVEPTEPVEPTTPVEEPSPVNVWLWVIVGLAVVVVIGVIWLIIRRRTA